MENPTTSTQQRLRITFAKTSAMRYTSHLDLHRAWERTFRRAGLPLAYSQGFNPHPRLNLASALPLGFTSQAEVLDAWLEEERSLEEIEEALTRSLPPGIRVLKTDEVDLKAPAVQTEVKAAEYVITLLETETGLGDRVTALLGRESITRRRRDKDYDLRSLIESLETMGPDEQGNQRLLACLAAREGATGRPEEVLDELGVDPLSTRIERTGLIFGS